MASLAAILFRSVVLHVPFDSPGVVRALAIGDAWGIYYFVPVLLGLSAVGELLFRVPRLALPAWVIGAALGVRTYQRIFFLGDFFLEIRNPLRWFGWFAGGWALAVGRRNVDGLSTAKRLTFASVLWSVGIGFYLAYLAWLPAGWTRTGAALEYAFVYCLILGTAMAAWQGSSRAWVCWLSSVSYPIYLYHYFFVATIQKSHGLFNRPLFVFAATLAASLAFVTMIQRMPWANSTILFGCRIKKLSG